MDIEKFIEEQKRLIDIEHQAEILENEEKIKDNSAQELENLGIAITNLKLRSIKTGISQIVQINLVRYNAPSKSLKDENNPAFKIPFNKIGNGDLVNIFMHQKSFQGNALLSGTIHKISNYKICISLQKDTDIEQLNLGGVKLMIVQSSNEITHIRYKKGFSQVEQIFKTKNSQNLHLFEVIFGLKSSKEINPFLRKNKMNVQNIKFFDSNLNDEQKQAVKESLNLQSLFLIHGPPGTGKTKTLCEIIKQYAKGGLKILASANSNIAVDNILNGISKCSNVKICRIGHPDRISQNLVGQYSLDALISKTSSFKLYKQEKTKEKEIMKKILKCTSKGEKLELRSQLYNQRKEIKQLGQQAVKEVLDDCNVILCTNSGSQDKIFSHYLKETFFDLVCIDEAAQAFEISCWLPLLKGRTAILAGDHKQLAPTIKSQKKSEKGLEVTLFDRLMSLIPHSSQLLKVQYRMNSKIMEWSSKFVYDGELIASDIVKDQVLQEDFPVLLLINTSDCGINENSVNKSKYNEGEAHLVKNIYNELKSIGMNDKEIGIITPYSAQAEHIRRVMMQSDQFTDQLEISTVDSFQGREKEAIIISMVRSNDKKEVGFLADFRRMNVAITRAKKSVILIGDCDTIQSDPFLKNLENYFQDHAEIRFAIEYQHDQEIKFNLKQKFQNNEESTNQKQQNKFQQNEKKPKQKNKLKSSNDKNEHTDNSSQQFKQMVQKVNEDDEKKRLTEIILNFLNDNNQQQIQIVDLNSFQRMIVHEISENLELIHESKGEGKNRIIQIQKKQQQLVIDCHNKQLQQSQIDNNKQQFIINNNNKQQLINQQQQQINDSNLQQQSIQQQQIQQQLQTNSNQQKQQQLQIDNNQQQQIQLQKQLKQQQNKLNQNNKQEKQKKQQQQEQFIDDMDFLDNQIQMNNQCNYQQNLVYCTANPNLLGSVCKFCGYKFCQKHILAETHGCGDKASEEAKKKFKNDYYDKSIQNKFDAQENEYLRKKALEKLASMKDRKTQIPKKKK